MKEKFHIGMRTLKTAFSVFSVVLISAFIPIDPQIAALSAVFSQRADINTSLSLGLRRTLSIVCGAFASIIFIFLSHLLPKHFLITALLAGLGIMITIKTNLLLKNPQGVIGGSATFLVIVFNIPAENQYIYALLRILDTFLGAIISVSIEYLFPRHRVIPWVKAYNRHVPEFLQISITDNT